MASPCLSVDALQSDRFKNIFKTYMHGCMQVGTLAGGTRCPTRVGEHMHVSYNLGKESKSRSGGRYQPMVAVVGAGHLKGIEEKWSTACDVSMLLEGPDTCESGSFRLTRVRFSNTACSFQPRRLCSARSCRNIWRQENVHAITHGKQVVDVDRTQTIVAPTIPR